MHEGVRSRVGREVSGWPTRGILPMVFGLCMGWLAIPAMASPYDFDPARAASEGLPFHDRFQSAVPLQTLRFYSGRIESEHMSDPDFLYGNYVVAGEQFSDTRNLALYTFSPDPDGQSVCTGGCAEVWPPLMVRGAHSIQLPAGFPGEVGVISRQSPQGFQVTLNGRPLYFYQPD